MISKKIFAILFFIHFSSTICFAQYKTNNTALLQKTIDQAKDSVFIENKTFNLNSSVFIKSNIKIIGKNVKIVQSAKNTPIFNIDNQENISITGIEFYGLGTDYIPTSSSTAVGILCSGAKNIKIYKNVFTNFSYSGISGLRNTYNIAIENNSFYGTGINKNIDIYQKDNTGLTIGGNNILIANNYFTNSSQGMIIAEESNSIKILNNTIENIVLEHGIYVDASCNKIVIDENTIKHVGGSGMKIQNRAFENTKCYNIKITNNFIDETRLGDGILINNTEGNKVYADSIVIIKNALNNIGQHGINIRIAKNGFISDNTINNVKFAGIYLKDDYNLIFTNNTISNCEENGVFDEGSGNNITFDTNTFSNVGSKGLDKNGLSSGIFIASGSNRILQNNTITGNEKTMQYAIYIADADQQSIIINNNKLFGARDYSIRLGEKKQNLKEFKNNTYKAKIGNTEILNDPNK